MKKKFPHIVLLALLAALLLGAPLALSLRPSSTPQLLRRKDAEWEGVLSLAVVPTFLTGGSLTGYASSVAKTFEKEHRGVLVDMREMTPYALEQAIAGGAAPDVVLFGSGALMDGSALMPLEGDLTSVRQDALAAALWAGKIAALPVAMGGYAILVFEEEYAKTGAADRENWMGRLDAMNAANCAVLCAMPETTYPMAGLVAATDGAVLGNSEVLAKNAGKTRRALAWPDFALEGKAAAYLGTQYEISRMRALEAGGRIGAWRAVEAEGIAYTDMLLLAGVIRPEYAGRAETQDNEQRKTAAGALLAAFHGDAAREALVSTGLVPVTDGGPLYLGIAGNEQMEIWLSGGAVIPNAFGQRADIAGAGLTAQEAARYLQSLGWSAGTSDGDESEATSRDALTTAANPIH